MRTPKNPIPTFPSRLGKGLEMAGHAPASVPCGLSSEGLPIGLHVVGRFGDESTVIAAAASFEEARPWADARPGVS